MISIKSLDTIKELAEMQFNMITEEALFIIIEDDKVIWRKKSPGFELDIFKIGEKLDRNSILLSVLKERKAVIENIPATLYGIKLKMVAEPLFDDDGDVKGVYLSLFPKLHPLAKAFNNFAPIVSEMFPGGAILLITDLEKILFKQSSSKFDLPMKVGDSIGAGPREIIRTKKPDIIEDDGSKSGFTAGALQIANYPIFDDEDSDEIIGTFGIITPKEAAVVVRDQSDNLKNSLTEIAATIQQMAAAASNIHMNEQKLNSEIKLVIGVTDKINEVTNFIRGIADKTKMLGLNAAIEAARAGESGRGFGVVAKEIRKLSDQSKSAVPKIQELTNDIKLRVDLCSEKSQNSLALSQEQAAATEEVTASVEEITTMSEELSRVANKL